MIWQIDFYRRPHNQPPALWDLLICSPNGDFRYEASCPQSEANSTWLTSQLELAAKLGKPNKIQVFRPQSLSLVEVAATNLNIQVEATRRTAALKQWLLEKKYPITIDKLPPVPIPENLLGDEWRFGAISSVDITDFISSRPIPILEVPDFLLPMNLGLASTQLIPGVVIYGGRQSMRLARWFKEANSQALNYIRGVPDGLILEAGLSDRWVAATFEDKDVTAAAKNYEQRKQQSHGLHFLLIQPDDSGMTYSGFWLLQGEE
jgi:hypothetical protein